MKRETPYRCESCDIVFEPKTHSKMRWAAAGAGLVVGTVATENVLGGLLIGGLTYGAVAAADHFYLSRRCPECGALGERAPGEEVREPEATAQGNGSTAQPQPSPVA